MTSTSRFYSPIPPPSLSISSPAAPLSRSHLHPISSSFLRPPALRVSASFLPRRRRASHLRRRSPAIAKPSSTSSARPSHDQGHVELSIDVDSALDRASASLARLYRSSERRLSHFVSSGVDACHDLLTSVRIDDSGGYGGRRVVFSCRRSSLLFAWNVVVWALVVVLSARVLQWFWSQLRPAWGFWDRTVVRRDRSLGGREVVVGRMSKVSDPVAWSSTTKALSSPLSLTRAGGGNRSTASSKPRLRARQEKLPEWWPISRTYPFVSSMQREEYQRQANALVRAIMDYRMSGKDYKEDDIIQLRRICRASGARVSFGTTNARDSFYRAAIEFILNICSRSRESPISRIDIDGEEVHQFLAGLANSIELEDIRAAVILCAAVAAKTRSCFLQAWALEVQGKRIEALEELLKISRILQIFPPEEQSPEIEMVAGGLERNLNLEQRKHLLDLLRGVCGAEIHRTAAAALGLEEGNDDFGDAHSR